MTGVRPGVFGASSAVESLLGSDGIRTGDPQFALFVEVVPRQEPSLSELVPRPDSSSRIRKEQNELDPAEKRGGV